MSSGLDDLLSDGSILLDGRAGDWCAALQLVGNLLEEIGVATADYTQSITDDVTEHQDS